MKAPLILASLAFLASIACQAATEHLSIAPAFGGPVPAPLILDGDAYELAGAIQVPSQTAVDLPGIRNFFRLSDTIFSGAEPSGQAGLETLAELGVRTIVSVDGKAPAAEAAAALGMRYVHVPIQYKGITPKEMTRLAKTFRDLEAPFFVHCFHGKHRGPAGAAVGRIVRDGAERGIAIAEMRQYAGTAETYEGLYRSIAARNIPAREVTDASDFDFAPIQLPQGVVGVMVIAARTHDHLRDLMDNYWAPLPEYPDIDAINEAQKLSEAFQKGASDEEVMGYPADFQDWWQAAAKHSAALVDSLELGYTGHAPSLAAANQHFEAVRDACSNCHDGYRNEE